MARIATQPSAPTAAPALAACIGVSVVHGSGDAAVVALKHVDASFAVGEAVALWGPSGSGKTTLLHVLGGLVEPTEGTVLWQDRPLTSLDAAARARARASGIAYVFQGSNLLPVFTVYENVAFAAHASGHRDDLESSALELLALVGLERKADNLPSELSGGEAQRVAIARALAQQPKLLLCDEPTGHLDSDTAGRVLELIEALRDRLGFTLVLATHDADIAAALPRHLELRDGAVVGENE
jgi:putative ABC transport system ATP-binding protein